MENRPLEKPRTPLNRELSLRGVVIGPEITQPQVIEIPAVPIKPAVAGGNEDKFITDTKSTLDELNIPEDFSAKVTKGVITFTENSPRTFELNEVIPRQEKLEIFTFETPNTPSPLVLFSHGGKISQSVIQSSGYLTMIKAANPNINLVAVNHRGSHNHAEKSDSSFDTRETDILIALKVAQENLVKGENWNGRVILMGDSMGGHVAASLAGKIEVDGVILTEPAAYSLEAQSTYWVYPDSKFKSGDKFKPHLINDHLFSATPKHLSDAKIPENEVAAAHLDPNSISGVLQKHPSNEESPAFEGLTALVKRNNKAKVLIITMDTDVVVPGSVNEGYVNAVKSVNPEALTEVKTPGGHGSTSAEEIRAISKFLK